MLNINSWLKFLKNVSLITFNQVLSLLGLFFLFGIILYFLSKFTRKVFVNTGNYKLDIYLTGWIGVPIHELGHAVFCIIFGHRINEIKLYQPNSYDGTLGYVNHSYDRRNYYHQIGNFFIGVGPIIFGSAILFVLIKLLVPNQKEILTLLTSNELQKLNISNLFDNLGFIFSYSLKLVGLLFTSSNFSSITFWIFLYISLCISSHMQLSPADLKGMWMGFFIIVFLLFAINAVAYLIGTNVTSFILIISSYFSFFFGLFFYSITISLINFFILYFIFSIIQLIKYKRLVSLR